MEMDQRRHKSVSIGTVFYHNDWKIIKLEHAFRVVKFNFTKTELNSLEIFSLGAYSFSNNKEIIIDSLKTKPKNLNHGKDIILVDSEKIVFPLILRKWEPGDFFHPINMNNHTKKVQDFLTDIKIDKINKNEIFVLLNANGQIIWVVGLRQDNRFKIEPNTEHILIFEIKIK
jgi:tRNA(Ile)-lysidine synthase